MPRVALDDFVQICQFRVVWHYYSRGAGSCRWHFMMPRAAGDIRALVRDRWLTYLGTPFRTGRPGAWSIRRLESADVFPGELPALVDEVDLGTIEEPDGIGLPPQISPLISWRTGDIGRANRGRTYMGPYTVDSVGSDNNVIDPANSAVFDFGEAMMAHFTGAAAVGHPAFVILSHQEDLTPIVPGAYSPVQEYFFLGRWATVRARSQYEWRT
jgi:hypothetical protein